MAALPMLARQRGCRSLAALVVFASVSAQPPLRRSLFVPAPGPLGATARPSFFVPAAGRPFVTAAGSTSQLSWSPQAAFREPSGASSPLLWGWVAACAAAAVAGVAPPSRPFSARTVRADSRGPVGYFAYDEVEVVARSGARSAETAYEQFVEGDRVRVTADVRVRGASAAGRLGTVTSAWSQCETDPACCCNELATDAPLEVRLDPLPADRDSRRAAVSASAARYPSTRVFPRSAGVPKHRRRNGAVRCGFEVETLEKKALEELNVMNWPNLEKRAEVFTKSAAADELLMVYVKEGSATLADDEETMAVAEGQVVLVQGGDVRWSELSEGGVTLLSVVTATEDIEAEDLEDEANALKANIAKNLTGSTRGLMAKPGDKDPDEPVTLTEYAGLLAAGSLAGGLLSFGLKKFLQGD